MKIGNFSVLSIFIIFIAIPLFGNPVFTIIISHISSDNYLIEKLSMLISYLLLLIFYFKIAIHDKIENSFNHPKNGVLVTLILIALTESIIHIGLSATQIYLIANISLESAKGLWEFKEQSFSWGIKDSLGLDSGLLKIFLFVVIQCILLPAVEELYFRGIILKKLSANHSSWGAILISTTIFTILHPYNQYFGVFFGGVILGYIYIKYNNLFLCIYLHGLTNLCLWIFAGIGAQDYITNKSPEKILLFSTWKIEIVFTLASAFFIVVLLWILNKTTMRTQSRSA